MSTVIGKFFEEFGENEEFLTVGRTVTETDVVNFCGFSGDFNPLHTDSEFASKQPFKERIAHGMCGFSIATGLFIRLNLLEGTILAFMGIEDWNFNLPIKINDTIHVSVKVKEKRESRKPGRGIIKFYLTVLNQKNESVMEGILRIMLHKKGVS